MEVFTSSVGDDLNIIFPYPNDFSMPTAGYYYAVGQWDDPLDPNYPSRNDSPAYATLTIRLWLPVTTYHQPPNIIPGDIRYNNQSIAGSHLWKQFNGAKTISQYMNEFGISLTYGFDSDERWITTVYNCQDTVSKDTVADNCEASWPMWSVNTPGVYTVTAKWFDGGVPNYYTGELASNSFTLHLWIPETTYIVEPLIQPGHIYQNGNVVDDSTFYEPVHPQTDPNQPPPYHIFQWLEAQGISAGYGIDSDSRVITTYQENGQPTASTTRYNNDTQWIPPGYFYLHQPGVYTVTWTYMDINNIPNFVDDPDTTRTLTLVVYALETIYKAGVAPIGGKISYPNGRWNNVSPYSYDSQAVISSVPDSQGITITCYAEWDSPWLDWLDIDERWLYDPYLDEEQFDTYVNDSKNGSGFWWYDNEFPGTFDSQNIDNPTWTAGTTYGIATLSLYIRDLPLHPDANDNDVLATGPPNIKIINVYESHLDRDIVNFNGRDNSYLEMYDYYGVHSSFWCCHSETHHAYDGIGGGNEDPDFYPWISYAFSTVYEYDRYYSDYSTLPLSKGMIVSFYDDIYAGPNSPQHSTTLTGNGTQVFQCNMPPGVFGLCSIEEVFASHQQYSKCFIWQKN